MKKFFEEAQFELVELTNTDDIITASATGSGDSEGIPGEQDPF